MKFCWTTINVKNMEESRAFYEKIVGLSVEKEFKPNDNMEIVFLGKGETKVELLYNSSFKNIHFGDNMSLGFEVASLDEMMEILEQKEIEIEFGPIQPSPDIKFVFVRDPNGLKIQFVENIIEE